jgi:hypothetical protein
MGAPLLQPRPLYQPRNPQASGLWRVASTHFDEFERVYDERFAPKYGFWRPIIRHSVQAYLKCGDLREGFARVRCPNCAHEMFVALSCKQRCACPSCHQKRALLTALHAAEEVCATVPHRQLVFTIPKRLRLHARFDRSLLGALALAAWGCVRSEACRLLSRDDVIPGMIAGIQTHGELVNWHPHIHALVTCGAFTETGEFAPLPAFDAPALLHAWEEAVYALYLRLGKIEPAVVEQIRGWRHSGFSVDQSVYLRASDQAGIERLMQYMTRCPFSISRLVKVSKDGTVLYKAEKHACRAFPLLAGDGMRPGAKRNYEVLSPLDFLAEFTQHIPPKGSHLVRYYGWYSNKSRGLRLKAARAAAPQPAVAAQEGSAPARPCNFTWAKLIKRVYEVDPLICPECGTTMKVVSFIEPPQQDVIEKILKHCGLWEEPARGPPAQGATVDRHNVEHALAETELTYVPIDEFLAEW